MDMKAVSQGMRISKSTKRAAQLHTLMLTIGCLTGGRCVEACDSPSAGCDWQSYYVGVGPPITDLEGSDDAVAKVRMAARSAVYAKNVYWMTTQNRPETDMVAEL